MARSTDYRIALRESMDRVDELLGFKHPKEFGQKTEPSAGEVEASKDRRLQDVRNRAGDEKMKYGFLQSLKRKVFGKKAEPEFKRIERSPEERRAAIIARAKDQGS